MQLTAHSSHMAMQRTASPCSTSGRTVMSLPVARPHVGGRELGCATHQPCQHAHLRDIRMHSTVATKEKWWEKSTPNMREVTGVQELVDALADAGDSLVIVDFYGPWCGACRALYPKLLKMMEQFPDVVFLKVNFDDNKAMCKTLGVKVLPFFHIYHGAEGRVAAFSCTVSKFQRMRDALENYYTPICSLEDNPGLPEFPDIVPHPNEITRLTSVAGVHLPIGPVGAASAAAAAAEQLMASQAAPAAVA